MPFDATTISLSDDLTDRLTAMHIEPVPLHVVNEHKDRTIKEFCRTMRGRGLVRSGAAAWRTLHMYRNLEILKIPRRHIGPTLDISAAPRPIVDLAERVAYDIRNAEFELEWFYTDPVLNVVWGGQRACLGVWDGGRIVAIAAHEGYVPEDPVAAEPKPSLWRRFLELVW